MVDQETLCEQIKTVFPDIGECGIDVDVDYDDEKEVIIEKLQQLERVARENGTAIGIGHHRKTTIQALKEELPRMEERGVELVIVSEVLE